MNPFEQMQLKQSSFTAADRKVYEVVINNVDSVLRGTATSLAEDFNISQPAITRFCKKLGYQGFSDFRVAMYQHHKSAAMGEAPSTAIDYYCKLLQLIPAAMEEADIDLLVDHILKSRFITTTGFHKSSLPARLLYLNLAKFGLAANYSSYDYVAPGAAMSADDTLVIFSASSKISQIKSVAKVAAVPCMFNINEPMIFGMPTVLNVFTYIPLLICSCIDFSAYYLLAQAGILGRFYITLPFTVPGPLQAFLSTMDPKTIILYFVLLAVDFCISFPFIKAYDKTLVDAEKAAESETQAA